MHYLEKRTILTTLMQTTFLHIYNTYNMNLLSKTNVTYNNNNTLIKVHMTRNFLLAYSKELSK